MLKEQIIKEMTEAMKAREALKLETLRMLKAEIMKYEVSGADKTATDEVVLDLIKRGVKQRKESAAAFQNGGNEEAAQKELDEIKILEFYLPEQMGEDELKSVVQKVIADTNAGPGDFGKVMGAVMAAVKGKADGGIVNRLVKELLG